MGKLPASRYDAFVSYSREDGAFAMRLRDRLESAGKNVWMDADDIPKGEDWRQQIRRGIELADNFIFLLSPASSTFSSIRCSCRKHSTGTRTNAVVASW